MGAAPKPRSAPSRWPPACLESRFEADGRGPAEGDGCAVRAGSSVLVHGLRGERESREGADTDAPLWSAVCVPTRRAVRLPLAIQRWAVVVEATH